MKYLIFTLALLLPILCFAQPKSTETRQGGLWSDPATWFNGVPVTGDTVHIRHNVLNTDHYDVGSGSLTVWSGNLTFGTAADLSADTSGIITVYIQGSIFMHAGDLYCDGCTLINDGEISIQGNAYFEAPAVFYNSCEFVTTFNTKFEQNVIADLHPGSQVTSLTNDIFIENQLKNNNAMISGANIKVSTTGSILGYSGYIVAFNQIVNDGHIEGGIDSSDYHRLWDGDCIISGAGTTNRVYICDTANPSNVTLCIPGGAPPLPVELVSIEATAQLDGSVILSWEVEIEENFSHYEIERLHGSDWEKIGEVNSKYNNLLTGGNYNYGDNPQITGNLVYYRLRMVDTDGTYEYSPVVGARVELLTGNVYIYPNPVNDRILNLTMTKKFKGIRIINISGVVVKELLLADNESKVQLEISDLPAGVYLLEVRGVSESIIEKFMKN